MPRPAMTGSTLGALVKELSLAAVMEAIPQSAVQQVLQATGTESKRQRLLPALLTAYLVILLALHPDVSVRENLRIFLEALQRRFDLEPLTPAVGSAISQARQRLGREPFEQLFDKLARPLGEASLPGCFWRGYRLVAVDGTSAEVQSTRENRERYGAYSNQHGEAGYPALKATVLLECGTHAPLLAVIGGANDDERELFDQRRSVLNQGMLLLADRYYYSFERFQDCATRAGALLWRVNKGLKLQPTRVLDDGSFLVELHPSRKLTRDGRSAKDERLLARVVEYEPLFEDGTSGEKVRLLTTLLDPAAAPAEELARLYPARWSEETGFDELKTHLKGPGRVLRGQRPALVEQEFFAFLLAYYVVRRTMVQAAQRNKIAPTTLSFVHAVRVIKRKLALPPSDAGTGGYLA
jgi:hypothetical protein